MPVCHALVRVGMFCDVHRYVPMATSADLRGHATLPDRKPIMQRRDFLTASALTAAVASLPVAAHAQAPASDREYYEWRTYRAASAAKRMFIGDYLEAAAVPAWNRMGLGPVGVFTETGEGATYAVNVLLVYPSLEKFVAARETLESNAEYLKAAAEYLAAKKDDAAFERIESSLMVAFAGMPKIALPKERGSLLELRTYESHSEERARKKIEMFNKLELPLFPESGFENIFFGETLIGANLPNLKYMLATSHDMAANKAAWDKFRALPGWLAIRDLPEYKDTVIKATPLFLEPTPYSQI
jgi:hypothetical protein